MKIIHINPNSLGERIGLKPGDRLLKINNKKVLDEIDYKFRIIEESLILDFEINGKFERVEIQKDYDIDLGVHFEELKIRACANDCVFCFVDQNPPGMRSGMYFRDGDYRMSYLYGHYVTMTNMGNNELSRVVEQKLSPLYVSIHTTNVKLRKELFLYKKDDDIIKKLEYLTKNKIEIHAQIVLMPTINDGSYLIETLHDIFAFHPLLKTCTIVPVGLTKHRQGLKTIPPVNKEFAIEMINHSKILKKRFYVNEIPFLLLSDEWYILSGVKFPKLIDYGDIDLSENGVGQVPYFLDKFESESKYFPKKINKPMHITILTGTLIEGVFRKRILPKLSKIINLKISVIAVVNKFFGDSVTVSGLLTGTDIIDTLRNNKIGDEVWMSHRILNEAQLVTLDDMTIQDIQNKLNCTIKVSNDSFLELINSINSE